ncbi:SMP-30/Gluconolaconase/LRE-like region [Novipirellula galeiformis]|uniref:SMP-30/Gluconolaconase/LRE-like region n=1 Tax=Novipirellula galeiformis TaxID=2528004 RepID=A0A5C6CFR8_9BACT|nr:SMP-30/gluconolactonase/LRE family protein [Novipirellula galeiformis]TWU22885.1 SMP-30/Gluconolaconase/LRE-like region [Novipirellula galeiformis]
MPEIRQAVALPVPSTDALRFLPEGPFALADGTFSWVGIQHGAQATHGSLNLYDLATETNQSFELPGRPGFAFPCKTANRFVVGCERSLGFFDTETKVFESFQDGIDASVDNTIINDGTLFEDNLVFGTKDLEFATRKAGLYLYRGRDAKLIQLRDDQICSNGKSIVKESDGSLSLYDIDSPTRQIVRYRLDIEAGSIGEPTVVVDLTSDAAVPDGAILTPDGKQLIVSMFLPDVAEFGSTRMYDIATGELVCVWQTPGSPQNTCPALVRYEGKIQLIITTAVENMDAEAKAKCPNAGQLFLAETDLVDDGGPINDCYWA